MADTVAAPTSTTTTTPAATGDAGAGTADAGKGTTQTPPAGEKTTALTAEAKTTGDQKDQAAGEGKTPSDTAPAAIEIKVPEGVTAEPGLLDGFKGVAKDLGLKSEDAQKLADWYFKESQAANQKSQAAQEQRVVTWAEEAKADKDIGGPNWDANLKTAQSAIRQFGSPDLTKMLNETGLGNHKAMIGLFAKIGKAIAEDKMPKGAVSAGDGQKQEVPLEQSLYPTMHPQT